MLDMNKKENEKMKTNIKKELKEQNILFILQKNREEELNEELDDMKDMVSNLKMEKNDIRKIDIKNKSIIKKLENLNEQKNENLMMINEELEWFIREYHSLKKQLNDKDSIIKIMEMKINQDNKEVS